MFRETTFGNVEHVSDLTTPGSVSPRGGEELRRRPSRAGAGVNRMAAPPSTPQKLAAEFLGTAFLVYVGAGSAAATGVFSGGTKGPFPTAPLGLPSFPFPLCGLRAGLR